MIYIIGNKCLDVCKIGYSERPNRRVKTIDHSIPFEIEVFKIMNGNRDDEHLLHTKYEKARIKGEWFILSKICEDLRLDIEMVKFFDESIIVHGNYVSLRSALRVLNIQRNMNSLGPFNYYNFVKNRDTKLFMESLLERKIEPHLKDGFNTWLHFLIFVEMCRTSGPKEKFEAYDKILFSPESKFYI